MEKQKYICFILLMFVCTVLLFLRQTEPATHDCVVKAELTADNTFCWDEEECCVCPVSRSRKSVLSSACGKVYIPVSAHSLRTLTPFPVSRGHIPVARSVLCIYRI